MNSPPVGGGGGQHITRVAATCGKRSGPGARYRGVCLCYTASTAARHLFLHNVAFNASAAYR